MARGALLLCLVLTAAAAAAAEGDASLSTRLAALEAAQRADRAELVQLRAQLAGRDRLREALPQLGRELRQLSRHVGGQAAVRDELEELRAEIGSFSQEVHAVKALGRPPPVSADHTTVQWLRERVTSLASQLAELSERANATELLQLRQESADRSEQLRLELRQLAERQQQLRAQHEAQRSRSAQVGAELAELREEARRQQDTFSSLLREVSALRRELLLGVPAGVSSGGRRRRHGRRSAGARFRQRVLADVLEVLYDKQLRLDERQVADQRNRSELAAGLAEQRRRLERLERRVEGAESEGRLLSWRLNATDGTGAARALKQSTSVLIREVEQLETKLDARTAALQAELARLDVGCGQLTTAVDELRQRQAGLPERADRLSQQLAAVSREHQVTRSQLMVLQADLLTLSLDGSGHTDPADLTLSPDRTDPTDPAGGAGT
ncbi:trichohyalin-like [Amphibalanus amphitrite]|uniref:trichohyalin-like n=1 Tax=Amphibalanus amphitrite TaxID=1232801 RepID=UPI001C916DBC|nr:trichohyalin-like [Amphibalanus amphitrite]XP_043214170.1 trichohyalin-like [Amphibalanus amphitrite]